MGSEGCGACHAAIFRDWRGSHHQRALATPTPDSVLGDFENAVHEEDGFRARFYRKGDEFRVETLDSSGERSDFRVHYVIGFDPLQQLLVEEPPGHLQTLPVAWDRGSEKWITLSPGGVTLAELGPGDWLHWTGGALDAKRATPCRRTIPVKSPMRMASRRFRRTRGRTRRTETARPRHARSRSAHPATRVEVGSSWSRHKASSFTIATRPN